MSIPIQNNTTTLNEVLTIANSLPEALLKSGGTMTGDIILKGDPTAALHAATKQYVDTALDTKMNKSNPSGTGSFSLNRKADTTVGTYSVAVGNGTTASGSFCFAEGDNTTASRTASHAEGSSTTASANYAHAEGCWTEASGEGAHAEGYESSATNIYTHAEGYNTTASGVYAHAEGQESVASGVISHAEGNTTTASGESSHVEGELTKVTTDTTVTAQKTSSTDAGYCGHAEGYGTVVCGSVSHAEGNGTTASGNYAHAEGNGTIASGKNSHAEGFTTTASGMNAHAEGGGTVIDSLTLYTTASGGGSHAEGLGTTASGDGSHAEGLGTTASGSVSHAAGRATTALDFQYVIGHYNGSSTAGSSSGTTGDAFIIGKGTSSAGSNAFRVTYAGKAYVATSGVSTGADYAEFFEWQDSNPNNEDRRGYFVTLDGENIKIAEPDDYILGIVSGMPCIIGNGDETWRGRYIQDEFGAFIAEEFEYEEEIQEKVVNEETGEATFETKIVTKTGTRYKENPDYDPTIPYIQREDRPEWDTVGMMGVLSVRDDGTCKVNGFCKVAEGGIATTAESGYRVISRVNENIVKIVFK